MVKKISRPPGIIQNPAEKTYSFQNEHNPYLPADYWFQSTPEGSVFFLVLFTQACRWAKCLGCNLPSRMSQYPVKFDAIMKQIDFVFDYLLHDQKEKLTKIIVSNNGSVLDEATFSSSALIYLVAQINRHCPRISVLSLETRVEYVDVPELEFLARALQEGEIQTDLELAIGFEAFDPRIRNTYFQKGLPLKNFESLARKVSDYGFRLKVYFMLKPVPQLNEEEAIEDALKGFQYFDEIARTYNLCLNIHLNPTFVARGTALEVEFHNGRYSPPFLESVRKVALAAEGKQFSLYIGLNDEGLAVPNGSFIRQGDEALLDRLAHFNSTQDFQLLK